MRVHFLQHVAFEGPGFLADWAQCKGYKQTITPLYLAGHRVTFPDMSAVDWLVVMGGPMSTCDEADYPWLVEEKRFLEQAICEGKRVVGICLGAQLLAEVLGARVYPNRQKEIGWFPIELTAQAKQSPLMRYWPERFEVLHWHGDTFDLPAGALHLVQSAVCRHQAFVFEQRVLGLQFHLEMTREGVEAIVEHCAHELVEGPTIQSADEILGQMQKLAVLHALMDNLLQNLLNIQEEE